MVHKERANNAAPLLDGKDLHMVGNDLEKFVKKAVEQFHDPSSLRRPGCRSWPDDLAEHRLDESNFAHRVLTVGTNRIDDQLHDLPFTARGTEPIQGSE